MKTNSKRPLFLLFLIFSVSLLSMNKIVAQENEIFEIQKKNENSKLSLKTENNRKRFYDLVFKLHPTHFIENNGLKVSYDSVDPVKMTIEDSKSINWLNNKGAKKNTLELITILLNDRNDLSNVLDLTISNEFNNLKYIFIKCNFKCSEIDIENFVKVKNEVRIFYTIQKPS